ncbi:MAG: hypothetical protein K2F98_03240 [Bacteroides sp.]|nr:hypothetical protein [Bacteroides sp.]
MLEHTQHRQTDETVCSLSNITINFLPAGKSPSYRRVVTLWRRADWSRLIGQLQSADWSTSVS